jgi:hypothetical protein
MKKTTITILILIGLAAGIFSWFSYFRSGSIQHPVPATQYFSNYTNEQYYAVTDISENNICIRPISPTKDEGGNYSLYEPFILHYLPWKRTWVKSDDSFPLPHSIKKEDWLILYKDSTKQDIAILNFKK